jgi:uncharacterized membrane-anchored protein
MTQQEQVLDFKHSSATRSLFIKVPEITAFFWIIKVLSTTVGETFADYLNSNLGLGLTGTSLVMTIALVVLLVAQFKMRKYVPATYWGSVVLMSVTGTLLTDNLTDNLGVSLMVSSGVFFVLLCIAFILWKRTEETLSIHSIDTNRREGFYWAIILLTFALGTATGDLVAERFSIGYGNSFLLFAGIIAVISLAWRAKIFGSIATFWFTYILTRPLGASIGDFLSQTKKGGGIGLGTTKTSLIFLSVILSLVVYLSITKKDQIKRVF